jgi:hypothetical protein
MVFTSLASWGCEAVVVNNDDCGQRLADAWSSIGQQREAESLATVNQLASELPSDNAVALFE